MSFIQKVQFDREKFFNLHFNIEKTDQDLIKEALDHFQKKSISVSLENSKLVEKSEFTIDNDYIKPNRSVSNFEIQSENPNDFSIHNYSIESKDDKKIEIEKKQDCQLIVLDKENSQPFKQYNSSLLNQRQANGQNFYQLPRSSKKYSSTLSNNNMRKDSDAEMVRKHSGTDPISSLSDELLSFKKEVLERLDNIELKIGENREERILEEIVALRSGISEVHREICLLKKPQVTIKHDLSPIYEKPELEEKKVSSTLTKNDKKKIPFKNEYKSIKVLNNKNKLKPLSTFTKIANSVVNSNSLSNKFTRTLRKAPNSLKSERQLTKGSINFTFGKINNF